ncbi:MAG TPA: 6-carboxytetrahydropterin synthase QueD [Longimicrobiales bacterium]|nr:6-carboxytetrahydropterin synthase QueD [Longimicrobiales bacterium]
MYVVTVQAHYDSAHFLRNYQGKCERLHGHRYVVEVALGTDRLNKSGLAFDFVDVKKHLREIADWLDHENINELPPFDEIEPSAENQARFFFDELKRRLPGEMADALLYARVWETPTQWAQYSERALAL